MSVPQTQVYARELPAKRNKKNVAKKPNHNNKWDLILLSL
jgi:hypothetical protein